MKTDDAKRCMDAARAEAERMGKSVCIAIVDAASMLVLFERLHDAAAFTAYVAEGKACASAFTGRDSLQLESTVNNYPALASSLAVKFHGRFVPIQGAIVIRDDSGIIGAVGVSGAAAAEDEQIAKAGAAAFAS